MSKILVWDLPTRLSHALLTMGFFACFSIAQFAGEHSPWFPFHMILGILLGVVVVLRVLWGFFGTKYARFDDFLYGPWELLNYLKGAFRRTEPRYVGHNPGSSYATFALLLLILICAGTGFLLSSGSEAAEEVHAIAAYVLLALVAVHILGVGWHTIRHRENISLSMVTGTKEGVISDAIRSSRPLTGVLFAVAIGLLAVGLVRNYNSDLQQTKIPLLNVAIQLGEAEHH